MARVFVMWQAIYGNRTMIEVDDGERFDRIMLGYISSTIKMRSDAKIDRTVVHIPGSNNIVIVYNKYHEEESLKRKLEYKGGDLSKFKPTAEIPELDFKLYARCAACRIDDSGNLQSLEPEDIETVIKYLAE